jgi:Sec-independent protein translocase protein TatA
MDAFSLGLPELLLMTVVALLVFGGARPPPSFWRHLRGHFDQLGNELDRRFDRERWVRRIPVHSAETLRGREAQFIRDRLPRKAPRARYVLLLVLAGVLVWSLTR